MSASQPAHEGVAGGDDVTARSEQQPTAAEDAEAEKRRLLKEEEGKLAAKYGMLKPSVSSVVQRRISRGGKGQYFDSGEYNKNKKGSGGGGGCGSGDAPVAADGGDPSQAPVAVTPGGPTAAAGPSRLSALPKSMQRKPSGASRLGVTD